MPIDVVRDVAVGGVLLTVSAADAARLPEFDPNAFVTPDPGWQPPYPYASGDVLLALG